MKRIHYLLLGLLVSLTIAAVSPSLPPTRIVAGSGVTVVTNGVNSFTISASGGSVVMNQNQFDSSSTNIKSSPLITNGFFYSTGTTNWPLRAFGTNGTSQVYVDKDANLNVQGRILAADGTYASIAGIGFTASPANVGLFGSGSSVVLQAASGGIVAFNVDGGQYVQLNTTRLNLNSVALAFNGDTYLSRNAANVLESHSGTAGLANRGTILAAKYTARAGTSTSTYNAGGLIIVDTTQTGNVGAGVDTLQTNSIAANTLAANGDTLVIEADGTFANTGASKQIILNFGTTAILTLPTSTYGFSAASAWRIRAKIVRTGAATQKASAEIILNNSEGVLPYTFYTTPTNTLSGAVGLWLTGEATADNDIVKEIYTVDFKPAP